MTVPSESTSTVFAAIDPSHQSNSDDDDQSSRATNQSVSSDNDSDYGITAMAIINRKELTELMTMVVPIAEQTMIDLQNFRKKVANALFT